jgi:peroxiredoxin
LAQATRCSPRSRFRFVAKFDSSYPRRSDLHTLPEDLPVPTDDGACDHLPGMVLPSIPLSSTDGKQIDLATLPGQTVVYVYPRTGRPGLPASPAWDAIPGARGCTPQSCGFRDHYAELRSLGASAIFGLSTQTTAYQREAVERLHLPFPLLSDSGLVFTRTLRLPTFEFEPYGEELSTLLKRMAFVIRDGRIEKVFYPVFPPNRNAEDVMAWLRTNA